MELTDNDEIIRKPAKITPRCAENLREAINYIAENSPKQADILQQSFFRILDLLEIMPEIGTRYKSDLRKIKLGKFRYNIYYKVKDEYISIRGIWHTSRGTEFEDS
jgi:plasmid stabilization system protein ParE